MPSINISEREIITPPSTDVTRNIVYIPGYANYGPTDTPILCESLKDFYSTFGSVPYKFNNSVNLPDTFAENALTGASPLYNEGDYEKSFIEAATLLSNGLPVLYERVSTGGANASIDLSTGRAPTTSSKNKATAKYKGAYGNYISITITVDSSVEPNKATIKIILDPTVTIDNTPTVEGINKKEEEFTVINKTPIVINSSLVDFSITNPLTTLASSKLSGGSSVFNIDKFFGKLESEDFYNRFADRGDYQIKLLTSGAYPSFEYNSSSIVKRMITAAATRGDCIALIDHTNNPNRKLDSDDSSSVYSSINTYVDENPIAVTRNLIDGSTLTEDGYSYGAMFTPHAVFGTNFSNQIMPASFGYLLALAKSIQSNPNYLAIAGVTRGLLKNNIVGLTQNITNVICNEYQNQNGVSINSITNIKPYGYAIWSNRTLRKNNGYLNALSLLNLRMLTTDIKKVTYSACQKYTFENNSDILWLNFKSSIDPTLAKMLTNNALSGYQILKLTSDRKGVLGAKINLIPIEPVEDWYVELELTDGTTSGIQ